MREAGDHAKMACGNLQLFAGFEAGIEGATHAVRQQRLVRVRERREEAEKAEEEEEEEEAGEVIAARLVNLNIETEGTEEEAAEGLAAALDTEVEEERDIEGGEDGGGTQRALEDLEFLTQEAEPSGTTLVDVSNGFNKLSHLAILWTVRHFRPAGARFAFNYYRRWVQLLLRQPGEPPVTILSREGVTQGEPLSVVLYGITLAPLPEDPRVADPGLLSPFMRTMWRSMVRQDEAHSS